MSFGWAGMGVIVVDEAQADPKIACELLKKPCDGLDSISSYGIAEQCTSTGEAAWVQQFIERYKLGNNSSWLGMGVVERSGKASVGEDGWPSMGVLTIGTEGIVDWKQQTPKAPKTVDTAPSMHDDHSAWCQRIISKYNLQHCAGWPGIGVITVNEHTESRKNSKESVGSAVSTQPPSEAM